MTNGMTDRHALYPTGLKDAPTRHRALRRRMAAPGIVVAPGAYDCITARLVEVAGFDACYITGSGVSMSALGVNGFCKKATPRSSVPPCAITFSV